jgi:methylphosphotriester-DNA--protein-cysteine methyltransferase
MLFRSYTPAPPLSEFVEDFWLYDDYRPRHPKERILPSGTVELVINLRDDELRIYDRVRPGVCERFSGAVVSGTYDRFFVIDTAEEASLLGVHFRAGGAFPFFGLPVGELVRTHVDLETLWGRSGRELREQLGNETRPIERFRSLEAVLGARLSGASRHDDVVRFAVDALSRSDASTVHAVTQRVGLSHRRFIEVFEARVGLTPKLFHRVRRFQRVLAHAQRAAAPVWSHLAVDFGFFDQSHLIRDFAQFSGFSPAQLAKHLQELERQGVHLKRHHLPLAG